MVEGERLAEHREVRPAVAVEVGRHHVLAGEALRQVARGVGETLRALVREEPQGAAGALAKDEVDVVVPVDVLGRCVGIHRGERDRLGDLGEGPASGVEAVVAQEARAVRQGEQEVHVSVVIEVHRRQATARVPARGAREDRLGQGPGAADVLEEAQDRAAAGLRDGDHEVELLVALLVLGLVGGAGAGVGPVEGRGVEHGIGRERGPRPRAVPVAPQGADSAGAPDQQRRRLRLPAPELLLAHVALQAEVDRRASPADRAEPHPRLGSRGRDGRRGGGGQGVGGGRRRQGEERGRVGGDDTEGAGLVLRLARRLEPALLQGLVLLEVGAALFAATELRQHGPVAVERRHAPGPREGLRHVEHRAVLTLRLVRALEVLEDHGVGQVRGHVVRCELAQPPKRRQCRFVVPADPRDAVAAPEQDGVVRSEGRGALHERSSGLDVLLSELRVGCAQQVLGRHVVRSQHVVERRPRTGPVRDQGRLGGTIAGQDHRGLHRRVVGRAPAAGCGEGGEGAGGERPGGPNDAPRATTPGNARFSSLHSCSRTGSRPGARPRAGLHSTTALCRCERAFARFGRPPAGSGSDRCRAPTGATPGATTRTYAAGRRRRPAPVLVGRPCPPSPARRGRRCDRSFGCTNPSGLWLWPPMAE